MAPSPRDYPSIQEYAAAQRELGSCLPEFRATMVKATQVGAGVGVPFGFYVAYRQGHRNFKGFAGKTAAVWLTTFLTFTTLGMMTGTYNCLRVKFERH